MVKPAKKIVPKLVDGKYVGSRKKAKMHGPTMRHGNTTGMKKVTNWFGVYIHKEDEPT